MSDKSWERLTSKSELSTATEYLKQVTDTGTKGNNRNKLRTGDTKIIIAKWSTHEEKCEWQKKVPHGKTMNAMRTVTVNGQTSTSELQVGTQWMPTVTQSANWQWHNSEQWTGDIKILNCECQGTSNQRSEQQTGNNNSELWTGDIKFLNCDHAYGSLKCERVTWFWTDCKWVSSTFWTVNGWHQCS